MLLRPVIVESPVASSNDRNALYAQLAVEDALARGDAPLSGPLLYAQAPAERVVLERARLAWLSGAQACVAYTDFGITHDMQRTIDAASDRGVAVEVRTLPPSLLAVLEKTVALKQPSLFQ